MLVKGFTPLSAKFCQRLGDAPEFLADFQACKGHEAYSDIIFDRHSDAEF